MDRRFLGIELGSTRIKAVVIDGTGDVLASGSFAWENRRADGGIWTYDLADARRGLAAAYADCAARFAERFGERPRRFDAIGISGMMHGYLAFDESDAPVAPFRTWRSTNAERAGQELSRHFGENIPIRWSVAQLYQSILDGEEHVGRIAHMTTLAGYVHFLLSGRRVLGIDDASGMFPVDAELKTYDPRKVDMFRSLTGIDVTEVFPTVLVAGEDAGSLTSEGAALLDETGVLESGIPLCPPEGDGGTGMVATNSVRPGTGNVSVGTSVFAMAVLERPIDRVNQWIDFVSTPSGDDVAMVHCNNGCGELDRWVDLFGGDYDSLLNEALSEGDPDCGGVLATNWISAEPLANVPESNPYLWHSPDARLTRANIVRAELYAVFATLASGMETLYAQGVRMSRFTGHGGLFTTPRVAQQILADALETPVAALNGAGEGGAWGVAALAAYRFHVLTGGGDSLPDFLGRTFFSASTPHVCGPDAKGVEGFRKFMVNIGKKKLETEK